MTTLHPVTNTGPIGSFEYAVATDTWVWSDELYAIHGFTPGDVVPTTDLVLSHKHPDDRDEVVRVIRQVREDGRPFAVWHRLVDASGTERQVVSVGSGVPGPSGVVVLIRGHMVDLSDAVRRAAAREVDEALEGLSQSRPLIEQVKGALMVTYQLDADSAFSLLRRHSQLVNVKVRDLAREFLEHVSSPGGLSAESRATWDRLAAELDGPSTTEGQPGQAAG